MRGTGKAARSKTNGFHAEITAVFLDEEVGGELGGAEQRMHGQIDRHAFVDAGFVTRPCLNFKARIHFPQGQMVGSVPVNFIRRGENEDGVWTTLARCFEKHERAVRIDSEVGMWIVSGPVMRRLGGCVYHKNDVLVVLAK